MHRRWWGFVPLIAIIFFGTGASAQMLGTSARQMKAGAWDLGIFYQGTFNQELTFSITDTANCVAGIASIPFACTTTGDLDAEGNGGALLFKATLQAKERGFQIYAAAGVGEYSVRVGSVTVFNSQVLNRSGFLTSLGAKAVLWPDTIVTPALAVDGSIGWQRYFGDGSRLDLLQFQLAVETSHRFRFEKDKFTLEPYGGVKWLSTRAWLTDVGSRQRVGGREDAISPFVGLRIPVFGGEDSIFTEVSFVKGVQLASGMSLRFG